MAFRAETLLFSATLLAVPALGEPARVFQSLDRPEVLAGLSHEQRDAEAQRMALPHVHRIAYGVFDPSPLYEMARASTPPPATVVFNPFTDVDVEVELHLAVLLDGEVLRWSDGLGDATYFSVVCPFARHDSPALDGKARHRSYSCTLIARLSPRSGIQYQLRRISAEPNLWAIDEISRRGVRDVLRRPPTEKH